jgi:hypothetical protein
LVSFSSGKQVTRIAICHADQFFPRSVSIDAGFVCAGHFRCFFCCKVKCA